MVRIHGSWHPIWISAAILSWMFVDWPAGAVGQEEPPAALPIMDAPRAFASSSSANQEVVDRLRKMEERLEQVTKQNEQLAREVRELRGLNQNRVGAIDEFPAVPPSDAGPGSGGADTGGSSGFAPSTLGGGSAAGGGDPTTSGRAQIVGNRQKGALGRRGHREQSAFAGCPDDIIATVAQHARPRLVLRSVLGVQPQCDGARVS
jgi:phosphate-selective porin OprO and OprP